MKKFITGLKGFISKHKKIIMFSAIILIIASLLTTTAITQFSGARSADDILTCSVPEGEVIAEGIDISKYQGSVDFEKVKADGIDFVILRVGTSQGGKDENFETYYQDAVNAGLDVGCYFYTYATSKEEAKAEAKQVIEYIDGKTFNYPVFLDFEYPELLASHRTSENTKMINVFCKVIKRAGYYPGVYTSNSIYKNHIDTSEIGSQWDVWVAHYIDETSDYTGYSEGFSMWQYSNTGTVSGISTEVDLDVCYVDYPTIIDEFNSKYNELDD